MLAKQPHDVAKCVAKPHAEGREGSIERVGRICSVGRANRTGWNWTEATEKRARVPAIKKRKSPSPGQGRHGCRTARANFEKRSVGAWRPETRGARQQEEQQKDPPPRFWGGLLLRNVAAKNTAFSPLRAWMREMCITEVEDFRLGGIRGEYGSAGASELTSQGA